MDRHKRTKKTGTDPPMEWPIPCKKCSTLAMMLLDDVPLCRTCIIKATQNREITWIRRHTRPLGIMGPVKVRDQKDGVGTPETAT